MQDFQYFDEPTFIYGSKHLLEVSWNTHAVCGTHTLKNILYLP